ncbi:MAG TPA: hypothetical protein VF865_16845 [Acidobacteriaceae bacterium]
MQEWVAADPSRTIRRFASHQEQEEADLRYWRDQPVAEKVKAVAELAEYFAAIHKIDLNAQGPKRVVSRVKRSRC